MPTRSALLRVVDANLNRAHEGLRVCEDLVRFILERPRHVRSLRGIRHALTPQALGLARFSTALLQARDSVRDPGRRFIPSRVDSVEALLLINFQRAKESVRVLEESARLLAPRHAGGLQQLRFRLYDVERDLLLDVAALRDRRRRSRRRA
jgi:thiamine-phosphate pyrophosphorylase